MEQHTTVPAPTARALPVGRRSWRAALFAGVLAGSCTVTACGDEATIDPPDGEACTVGVAAVDGQVDGTFATGSCAVQSDARHRPRLAQSWTLHAEAGTAYLVRLNPVGVADGIDLMAMTRGHGGTPRYATLGINTYAETGESLDDTRSTELLLPSFRDQEISLRVESDGPADSVRYALSVARCPIRTLELGTTLDSLVITGSCQLRAYPFANAPVDAVFLGFRPTSAEDHVVRAERQEGAVPIRGFVAGPDLDLTWTHTSNVMELIGAGTTLYREFGVDTLGPYTFVVAKPVGSPVSVAVQVSTLAAAPVARR
jgi:hypothetical protein